MSLCAPPVCVTEQRQVSDCAAGARELPSSLAALRNNTFSEWLSSCCHWGSGGLEFFVLSCQQLLPEMTCHRAYDMVHFEPSFSPLGGLQRNPSKRLALRHQCHRVCSLSQPLKSSSFMVSTPESVDSCTFVSRDLINKLNTPHVHKPDGSMWVGSCCFPGSYLVRAERWENDEPDLKKPARLRPWGTPLLQKQRRQS